MKNCMLSVCKLILVVSVLALCVGGMPLRPVEAAPLQASKIPTAQVAPLMAASWLGPNQPQAGLPRPPQSQLAALETTDNFGYVDSAQALSPTFNALQPWWVSDVTVPTTDVTFPGGQFPGDAISDPITIPFQFPYYDNVYTTLNVSMNGVVRFGYNSIDSDKTNYPMPTGDLSPAAPTNFIAALWSNLDVSSTTDVYVQQLGPGLPFMGSLSAFVITWKNVVRYGVANPDNPDDQFTFQVVLKDNGDIYVNLKDLATTPGNLTIGIEDSSGVDGLTHHYNGGVEPIQEAWSIGFIRPSPNFPLRVFPVWQGQFTQNGSAVFSFNIKNISPISDPDLARDSYDLTFTSVPASWGVKFFQANGYTPLGDFNGNAIPDTGLVEKNAVITIVAKVNALSPTVPGDDARLQIDAKSLDGRSRSTTLQVAVPSAFVDTYSDGTGTYLGLVWKLNKLKTRVSGYSGLTGNLAVEDWSKGYVYVWVEKNLFAGPYFEDYEIHYAFLDHLGFKRKEGVIDHAGVSDINDSLPALATNYTTGDTVLVWVQDTGKVKAVVLNPDNPNAIVNGPFTLVDNNTYSYTFPAVAHQKGTTKFTAAWVEKEKNLLTKQIKVAIINTAGSPGSPVSILSASDTQLLYGLSMEGMDSGAYVGRIILFYIDTLTGAPQLNYRVLTDTIASVPVLLSSSVSADQTSVSSDLVTAKKIVVAWLDPAVDVIDYDYDIQGVSFRVLNPTSSAIEMTSINSLYAPNLLNADYISVTSDKDGYAVFMWTDSFTHRYSYYAFVNPNVPAPPLTNATLIQTLPAGSTVFLSYNGQGLASYVGRYNVFLPLVRK